MSRKSSEETRKRILEATWKLLNGADEPTRMSDVAREAGVSRQAVYLHFPSRADLLVATTRYIDEVEDVGGQMGAVFTHGTGRDQLEAFVQTWGNYIPIVHGGAKRLLAIKDTDSDAEAAWQDRMTGLYNVCSSVIDALAGDGQLAEGLTSTEATDLMWSIVSVRQWENLTIDRGMTHERYLELTHLTLLRTLVAP